MEPTDAVTCMQALGHDARLGAYRALVRAGARGLSIGEIQAALEDMPRSTLAHHLQKLLDAGLVDQEKRGATVISRAHYQTMDDLVGYLTEACCIDDPTRRGAEVWPVGLDEFRTDAPR